jgi:hypothetical protein
MLLCHVLNMIFTLVTAFLNFKLLRVCKEVFCKYNIEYVIRGLLIFMIFFICIHNLILISSGFYHKNFIT